MRRETLETVARWQRALDQDDESLDITFHGGEPLVPGMDFYRMALPLLRSQLAPREIHFSVQSNLWLLTDELCELFSEHDVSLGTSLDGPQAINDAQRGEGYFGRTMSAIERARSHGLGVGCVATFTAQSAARADEVLDFFLREGLGFSIHAALPPLGHSGDGWALSAQAHGQLLVDMLDRYVDCADRIRIGTLDAICRSVSARRGAICTFGDCLGEYLAVDPQGWITPCQRFAGLAPYRVGNVHDAPMEEGLSQAPFWRALADRQRRIEEACGDCPYLDICRGGCPYNVLAANGATSRASFDGALRDPHCPAYRRIFGHITDRALEEVFSEENLSAVVEGGAHRHGLIRRGRLLQLVRGGPHPKDVARRAREVVAAAALGASASPSEALGRLERAGVVTRPEQALQSLTGLRERLNAQPHDGLVNAYLHVTYRCNLECSHCYADSRPAPSPEMVVADVAALVRQAAEAGFRKAIITGGEPLMHSQRHALLDTLRELRREAKPLQTVLRTNLAYALTPALLDRLGCSTDQVVVSVDGDESSHDARRGPGTYARTVQNLHALVGSDPIAEVGITTVLTPEQMAGPEAQAVHGLAEELGVRLRLKTVLPLGRAAELALTPSYYSSLDDDADRLAYGGGPTSTCGLGMNLYVGPGGACYPCYALMGKRHHLGNALHDGLGAVLARNDAYREVTVDSNAACRECDLRYLCGGFCRAWGSKDDPDAPPLDCSALYARAQRQLWSALEILKIETKRWEGAGLHPANRENRLNRIVRGG